MKRIFLAIALLVALFPALAFSEPTHFGIDYPQLGRGVRPLGMGNAFTTMKGTDQNALFYNPAAISDYGNEITWVTSLPVPPFEFNYGTINLIRDLFNFRDDVQSASGASAKTEVFRQFVDKHIGQFHDLEMHFPIAGAYNRYFSISLINDEYIGISFRNRAFPNFEVKTQALAGLALGSAYSFFDDYLEIGAAIKGIYGVGIQQVVTTNDILQNNMHDFEWKNWKRGLGIGFDAGVKFLLPDFGQDWIDTLKPTFSVTYQNIGNTKFRWMKKNGGLDQLPQTVSAGVGIHPVFDSIETSFLVDIREINVKEDFLMKLNAGAEVRFPERLGIKPSLRAGCNQGYPAVGGGIEVWKLTWNVAFYGKELGQYTREKAGWRLANEFIWKF